MSHNVNTSIVPFVARAVLNGSQDYDEVLSPLTFPEGVANGELNYQIDDVEYPLKELVHNEWKYYIFNKNKPQLSENIISDVWTKGDLIVFMVN